MKRLESMMISYSRPTSPISRRAAALAASRDLLWILSGPRSEEASFFLPEERPFKTLSCENRYHERPFHQGPSAFPLSVEGLFSLPDFIWASWALPQISAGAALTREFDGERAAPIAYHRAFSDRKSTRLNSSHGYISYAVF